MHARTLVAMLATLAVFAAPALVRAEGDEKPAGLVAHLEPEKDESHLYSVQFAPDGKSVYTVLDKKVHVWDSKDWKEARTHKMVDSEQKLILSADGKTFAWTEGANAGKVDGAVSIYDAESGELVRTLSVKPEWGEVANIAVSPDRKTVYACGALSSGKPFIWAWEWETGKRVALNVPEIPVPEGTTISDRFYTLAVSPDGKQIATALQNKYTIAVIEVASGKLQKELKSGEHVAKSLAFSPDGKKLATCGFSELVRVYDVESGKLACKFEQSYAVCVRWLDAKTLASSDREQFCLWDTETKKAIAFFGRKGRMKAVHNDQGAANGPECGMAVSPDGKLLAWGCEYEEWSHVRIWSVEELRKAPEPK
jgi:WD40 repeat protein